MEEKWYKKSAEEIINELETSKNTIRELEKKLEKLQLIKAFGASSVDVKEAKQKINKIVREIDKCISMLND